MPSCKQSPLTTQSTHLLYTMTTELRYIVGQSKQAFSLHQSRIAEVDATSLLPHIQSHFRIFDVGCGPRSISAEFHCNASRRRNLHFNAEKDSLLGGVYNLTLDAEVFPVECFNSFDIIFESVSLVRLATPVKVIQNFKQFLRLAQAPSQPAIEMSGLALSCPT